MLGGFRAFEERLVIPAWLKFAELDLSRQLVACSHSFQQFYLQHAFHQRYLFSTCFKLENLFDVNSCGSKSCFTIEISLESVGRFA